MNIPEDQFRLYAEYGITAEKAQALETEAGNVILGFVSLVYGTKEIDDERREFFVSVINSVNRATFGGLLKQIRELVHFNEQALEIVDNALELRNYLAHRFFRTHNFAMFGQEGRKTMIQELKDIQKKIDMAYASLSSLSSLLLKQCGIDLPDVEKLTTAAKKLRI